MAINTSALLACQRIEVEPYTAEWRLKILLTTGYANHTIYIQYDPNSSSFQLRRCYAKDDIVTTSFAPVAFSEAANTNGKQAGAEKLSLRHRRRRSRLGLVLSPCLRPYRSRGLLTLRGQLSLRCLPPFLRESVFDAEHQMPAP